MKVINDKQFALRKKDDRYQVYDLQLEDFTLSTTYLNRGKATTGHSHDVEEVYYFMEGYGQIQIGGTSYEVEAGDFAVIPGGAFHRAFNIRCPKLVFLSIFKGVKT